MTVSSARPATKLSRVRKRKFSLLSVQLGNIHFQPRRFAVLKWFDVCVCVLGWNELKVSTMVAYSHIYQFIPYYASVYTQ